MTGTKTIRRVISATALAACCLQGAQAADTNDRIGRAYDPKTGELVYEERHQETVDGGQVLADRVRYLGPDGKTFASKNVDFRANPFVPDFRLVNERSGHQEALRRSGAGALDVSCREHSGKQVRDARLVMPDGAIADAGFDRFIEAHFDTLLARRDLMRRFLVPCRLEFMEFRFRRTDADDDPGHVRFAVELDSALLRLFVPTISVTYERGTRRLLRYEGLSNLRDANGDNHAVRIEFQYPRQSASSGEPPAARSPRVLPAPATARSAAPAIAARPPAS